MPEEWFDLLRDTIKILGLAGLTGFVSYLLGKRKSEARLKELALERRLSDLFLTARSDELADRFSSP